MEAQFSLAICCFVGFGVREDKDEAAMWFHKAAKQGHPEASSYLITCCKMGYCESFDQETLLEVYQKCAERGDSWARCKLGVHYLDSNIPEEKAKAVEWLIKAAEQGEKEAQFFLNLLNK